jgi:Fe-S-cluster containining protein
MNKKWLEKGIQFECQGSGKCCVSHGEYGYVYLDKKDRTKLAKFLNLSLSEFMKTFCKLSDGFYHLKSDHKSEECVFLKKKKCTVYEARPTQCKTWPFWPEVLNPKSWNQDVRSFCPGVGKGKIFTAKEVQNIAAEQTLSELLMDKEP